jgi:hypothetical protein
MNIRQYRENRATIPQGQLAKYHGQWVAFSPASKTIVGSANDLIALDAQLIASGVDVDRVGLEFIDVTETSLGGAELSYC